MPLKDYSTKIPARRTAGEIQELLAELGANAVQVEYDDRRLPIAISFTAHVVSRRISFRLPSRWQGVLKILKEDPQIPRALKTEEQARNVGWRIVKDWVSAQMAIIQSGAAEMAEVFLPYAVHPENGMTLFEEFVEGNLLSSGEITDGEYKENEE